LAKRNSSDALRFARVAKQRLVEARVILQADLPSAAQYFCGYAVECILKALLLEMMTATERRRLGGDTDKWMEKEFGHDLIRLRDALANRGARMSHETSREFLGILAPRRWSIGRIPARFESE
jgi:hypothetical protein